MKNLFSLKSSAIAFFTLIGLLSCSSDEGSDSSIKESIVEMDFIIGVGETLTYSLGGHPTEGGWDIILQPKHAMVSRIFSSSNGLQYEYIPTTGFIGKDYLELRLISSTGASVFAKTIIKITIEVKTE